MARPINGIAPNGDPSADIHQLRDNIAAFLGAHPVGSENMGTPPTILPAHAKLVKSTTWNKYPPAVYNMQWTDTPSANTVKAYFVDYKSISSQGRNVPFVDIPARPEADFLFTGELIGCSLIVVRRGDGLRVYHDSRYSSSALYDNVVMAVDFRDYAEEYTDPTMRKIDPATACMQFKSGQWTLYLQFLGENTQPIDQVPRGGVPEGKRIQRFRNVGGPRDRPFISRTRYDAVDIEQERESLYQKLKEVAVEYLGEESIPATQDSLFQDFPSTGPPSMNNPAVARTEALRQAMLDLDLENMIKRRVDLKRQEAERQKERPENPEEDVYKEYRRLDLAYRKFLKEKSDSKSTDATYLWLQLKKKHGLQAVVAH